MRHDSDVEALVDRYFEMGLWNSILRQLPGSFLAISSPGECTRSKLQKPAATSPRPWPITTNAPVCLHGRERWVRADGQNVDATGPPLEGQSASLWSGGHSGDPTHRPPAVPVAHSAAGRTAE